MQSTRRTFLKTGALGVSISFLAPDFLLKSAMGGQFAPGKVLVILQLAGGNDTVNTFIPYADSKYRTLRPTLGIPDAQILKLDDRMGFHPSMSKLQTLYQRGKLAFVNNVGFASLDRSHFRCQDVWQTADDSYGQTQRGITGWLGRYADTYLPDIGSSLTTLSIGSKIALGLNANEVIAAAVQNAATFDVQTDSRYPGDGASYKATLRAIYDSARPPGSLEVVQNNGKEMFGSIDLLKTIPAASTTAIYPSSGLGNGLKLIAQVLAGDLGTQAVWISNGGFDTHGAQLNTHANLWTDVSESLSAFYDDLATRGISDRVMVMGWSEFGRRVQENASAGTDHGKAGTVLLMGDGIKGGTFYGDVPNLNDLDAGDLKTQIDFRSIYSTIISDWYGKDPLPVLNTSYANLGFVNRARPHVRGARR
ncbi:MAG TPA: DUF1501 domain-containing protein [Thermoanaerobaculia bacterium]|nr:DUF1501 domain-containing protein [Thermoanaerobaculia bacterium]